MKSKKAFTLIEILISISLFMLIIVFLYQALDMTQKSNNFFASKLDIKKHQNNIKKILFLDLISQNKTIANTQIKKDRDNNSILSFSTSNIYHNPFYTNITYMISRKGNLIRIESKEKFNYTDLPNDFFNHAFIDILDHNITKFKVKIQQNKSLAIYIENKNNTKIMLNFTAK